MFTIKFYSDNGGRQRILEAESLTILRCGEVTVGGGEAEITLHQKNQSDDCRYDIDVAPAPDYVGPPIFQKVIIENSAGKTTEIIQLSPK